jgi:hypothetical protein
MLNVVRDRLAFAFPYPKELIEPVIRLPQVAWKGRTRFIGGHRLIKVWQAPVALVGGRCGGGPGAILAPLFEKQKDPAGPRPGLSKFLGQAFGVACAKARRLGWMV